jgi:hypothetical protein
MKEDGHIGGRQSVMAADQHEGTCTSVTNNLHFTVLAFTAGTGEAIMCAVILISEKAVSEIPISWKIGRDVAKDIKTGETLVDIYDNNKASGVSIGGPVCTFQGKHLPCFVCTIPNASITIELLAEMLGAIN